MAGGHLCRVAQRLLESEPVAHPSDSDVLATCAHGDMCESSVNVKRRPKNREAATGAESGSESSSPTPTLTRTRTSALALTLTRARTPTLTRTLTLTQT